MNVAASGKFSSDRTIAEYAREIWHAEPFLTENAHRRSDGANQLPKEGENMNNTIPNANPEGPGRPALFGKKNGQAGELLLRQIGKPNRRFQPVESDTCRLNLSCGF
jgi:hypothetical protein